MLKGSAYIVLVVINRRRAGDVPASTGIRFEPPNCLHCPFYPLRGPYSSASVELIRQHLQEMESYGIGVLVSGMRDGLLGEWAPGLHACSLTTLPRDHSRYSYIAPRIAGLKTWSVGFGGSHIVCSLN